MLQKPPLPGIFAEIQVNKEEKWTNWHKIIKKNEQLAVAKRCFSRTPRTTTAQLSEFLCSTHLFPFIQNTIVHQKIDNLTRNLRSSRKIFMLRQLGPKRKVEKLSDCYLQDNELETLLDQIFSIFQIETHIGTENKKLIVTWILDTVLCRKAGYKKVFVYKEAPFARAFRSKTVMSDKLPIEKRGIQMLIVNNLMAGVFWWILIAMRQCISVIPDQRSSVLLWRTGYLKFLKKEMADFKKRYHVRRLKDIEKLKFSTTTTPIGRLRFTIVRQKLRPVFPRNTGNRNKFTEFAYWKRINSMLDWCMRQKGCGKMAIRNSCKILYKFLREKREKKEKVTAFTADITKCFSTVNHSILMGILMFLIDQNTTLYSISGFGRDELNRYKLIHCSADSGKEAIRLLEEKMKFRRVKNFERNSMETASTKWLLNELRSTITSYYFNRGKTLWKVTKGVPQGHPLSSHLAHVYLNEFEKENWEIDKENEQKMVYCRYEDDYLICTTDKKLATKMLTPLFNGKNRYGLVANREKSQVSQDTLKWCGIRIGLENLKFACKIRCSDKKMRQVTLIEKQLT